MKSAIIHCGQLVTVSGSGPKTGPAMSDLGIIPDGAVIWEEGRITHVGTTDELRPHLPPDSQTTDLEGKVLTPGLVDAHTHLVFAGSRANEFEARAQGKSYVEIAAEGGGILSTVRAVRTATEDELFDQARQHADWMIANGTTTAESKSGYGLDLESELKILRVNRRLREQGPLKISSTFLGAHAVPPEFKGRSDDYVALVEDEMLPAVAREGLATWCDVFCESIAFRQEQTARIASAAKSHGLKLRLHVDQLTSAGGAQLAARLGAKTADHLELVSAEGIRALADKGVTPVHLPASVFCLGHTTYPPARAMIAAGLPVVLATDFNPGSSPTPSLPFVMSLACTQMGMTPAEALLACTLNAAHSLDLGHDVGSIDVGKSADLTAWNCSDYREIPYFAGAPLCQHVWASGQLLTRRQASD